MTQTVTDADGTIHEFPDDATPAEMNAALGGQKTGGGAPPNSSPAAGSSGASTNQPSPMDARFANIFLAPWKQYQGAQAGMSNFLHGFTGGLDNRIASAISGTPLAQEQAQTEANQEKLGPVLSTLTGGAGYTMGPGKIFGPVAKAVSGPLANVAGGLVPSAIEGGTASTFQAGAEGKSPEEMEKAGAEGTVGGGIIGPLAQKIAGLRKIMPNMPSTDDLKDAAANMWDKTKGVFWSPLQLQGVSRDAWGQATAGGQPMTKVGNGDAHTLFTKFADATTEGQPFSVKDVHDWQKAALALPDGDSAYGDILHRRLEDLMQNQPPAKVPKGMDPTDVPAAIGQARGAQQTADIFDRLDQIQNEARLGGAGVRPAVGQYLRTDPDIPQDSFDALRKIQQGTNTGNAADYISAHSWRIGHMLPEVAMLAAAGAGGEHVGGGLGTAIASIGGIAAGVPLVGRATGAVSSRSTANLVDAARRTASGTAAPYNDTALQDLIRRGMIGGVTANQ
jgi:hypothetical protein